MSKSDMKKWASEVDLDATRTLITELQTKGKPWFKVEKEQKKYVRNYLRICPKRPEWPTPYQIVPVHYLGPNNQMVVCLREAKIGECPACQLRWELERGNDKKGAQGLRPSVRTFMNVVQLNEDGTLAEENIFLLGLNKLQFLGKQGFEPDLDEEGELPLYFFFEKYGDLSHVETGRDLLIKAKDEKSGDYDTVHMKFSVADPSPFPGTSDLLEEELTSLPEVVPTFEASDMVALIEGRSGATVLSVTEGEVVPQIEAPRNRFGDEDEDKEETPTADAEAPAEEEKTEAKSPPQTNPKAAMERLNKHLEKNGKSE